MAIIYTRPKDLPAAASVSATDALPVDNGVAVGNATPKQIVDAGRPVATEAQAIAGTDNQTAMTPLTTRQAINSDTSGSVARAEEAAEAAEASAALVEAELFSSRTALVEWVAEGNDIVAGREYRANGLSYLGSSLANDISDLPGLVPAGAVTPQHFGAVADGETDDTDAFNAAVTSLPVAGGEVFVPKGTYRVSSVKLHGADNLHSNVTLRLDSGAVIKKLAHADITTDAGRKGNVIEALYGDGHKVFGGKVEGNLSNGGQTPPYCTKHTLGNTFGSVGRNISVAADGTSSTGAATDDVYQITASGAGQVSSGTNISDDVSAGYVTKVYTQSTGVGAYNEEDGSGYLNSFELDNDFGYRHCIYLNGLSSAMNACEVSGVECTDAVYGGILVGAGPLFASETGYGTTNGSITDCYVHDNGATCIGGGKKVKATITGNRVGTTDSSGIRCDEGSHECVIANNIIDCNDRANSNGGVNVYKSDRVTVTGNFITRTSIGVSINESDLATVTANNVKDVGTGVSLSKCDNGSVTANIIDITTADGIKMTNGSNNAVAGNSLSNIGDNPITDTSANSVVTGNAGAPATLYNQNTMLDFATGGTLYLGGAPGSENLQVTPGSGTIVNRMVVKGGAGGASTAPSLSVDGTSTDIDMRFLPKGTGKLRFGSHSALAGETVTGYIEIKDASGTVRKLAVVS